MGFCRTNSVLTPKIMRAFVTDMRNLNQVSLAISEFYVVSFLGVGWDWIHLVRRSIAALLYQPRMIDDECGVVGVLRIGRGNWSIRGKHALLLLCPPQIPYDLISAQTRAPAVGSWRLTAWTMARHFHYLILYSVSIVIIVRVGKKDFDSRQGQEILLFSIAPRLAVGSTQFLSSIITTTLDLTRKWYISN
jgi:hypothetical protein